MTKEQLREDPILEHIQSFMSFVERNARWIALGAAIVVVVIVGSVMVDRSKKRAEAEAETLLGAGQTYYLQGNYANSEGQLRELLDAYGGTRAAISGRIYMGDALLAQGRADEALVYFDEATSKARDTLLKAAANRGRASALETSLRWSEASVAYEEASAFETTFKTDDVIAAARTALKAGDAARAKTLLEGAEAEGDRNAQQSISFYLAQAEAVLH